MRTRNSFAKSESLERRTLFSALEGPIVDPGNGHSYYIVAQGTWTTSESEAESLGGHLVTIRSADENQWIVNNLLVNFAGTSSPQLSDVPVWIGLEDPTHDTNGVAHASNFNWADNEALSYTDWDPGQPDNSSPGEYYGTIGWQAAYGTTSDHGTWNDTPLGGTVGYGGTTDGPYYGIAEVDAAPRSPIYDAVSNFSATTNPNGVWSYGTRATEASDFTPYPESGEVELNAETTGWHTAGNDGPPYVALNSGTTPDVESTVTVPPNVLDLHPGPDGTYTDVRFTVPTAGAVSLSFAYNGIDRDGTTTDVHVLHDGVSIADGNINGYQDVYAQTVSVDNAAAGDTIDFIVGFGSNDNYFDDSTSLTAIVTAGAASTPGQSIGGLDPVFGNDGLAAHDVGFTSTSGVATDGTQSVLIGPIGTVPSEAFGVTRYNGDGSLDTGFGSGGVVATSFGSTDAVPTAVDVLSDGDILVAGTATTPGSGSEFAIAEYNADGSLNTGFGTGGEMLVGFSGVAGTFSNDLLHALAVAPSGTIYLGGSTDAAGAGNTDLAIAALSPVGGLISTFGTGGTAVADVAGGDDVINALAVQSNGDVVAAGAATVSGLSEVALARFSTAGVLDKKFGDKGIATDAVGNVYDSASSVVIQPKGQLVIGGFTASGSGASLTTDFLLQRYTTAGRLDHSFSGGTIDTSFGQPAAVTQLALQGDGSIVASGKTSSVLGGTLNVALARYTTRGTLDPSFGTGGEVVIDLGSGIVAAAASNLGEAFDAFVASEQGTVGITQGGEILAAGSSGADTVEAELIAAGVDLLTQVLSTFPASVLQGAKGKVQVSVTEDGTTAAKGLVTITIEFAADAAGDGATGAQNFSEKVNLKQGQSKTYKLSFNFSSSGNAFVVADVTNGAGVAADLNPDDNSAASTAPVAVAPAFVSLGGAGLSASALTPGKPATFSITITNTGNVTAKGKTEVFFYVSTDGTVADGTLVGVAPLGVSLPAGKSKVYRLKVSVPTAIPAGTFTLLGVIDPANVLGNDDAVVVAATAVTTV